MKLQKRGKKWFIINVPKGWYVEEYGPEYGPYDSKDEAEEDLEGMHKLALQEPDLL